MQLHEKRITGSKHQPGVLDCSEGVCSLTILLCDSGDCGYHLLFGFIIVQFEFKLGVNSVLNNADLQRNIKKDK